MRPVVFLIVLLLLIVGGAILLSRSVTEEPLRTIEVPVATSAAPEAK